MSLLIPEPELIQYMGKTQPYTSQICSKRQNSISKNLHSVVGGKRRKKKIKRTPKAFSQVVFLFSLVLIAFVMFLIPCRSSKATAREPASPTWKLVTGAKLNCILLLLLFSGFRLYLINRLHWCYPESKDKMQTW